MSSSWQEVTPGGRGRVWTSGERQAGVGGWSRRQRLVLVLEDAPQRFRADPAAALLFDLAAGVQLPRLMRLLGGELVEALEPIGGSSPASTAARTAQPGSVRCWQSRNRQSAARSSMSLKAPATDSPESHNCSSRMPGRIDQHAAARAASRAAGQCSYAGRGCRTIARRASGAARGRSTDSRSTTSRRPTIRAARRSDRCRDSVRSTSSVAGWRDETACTSTPGADGAHLLDDRRGVLDEIGLVQDHDRRRAAVPGDDEVALDAPGVVIAVEAGHQEHHVDVGGDDLLLGRIAGGAPREPAQSRQHAVNASPRRPAAAAARWRPSRRPRESPHDAPRDGAAGRTRARGVRRRRRTRDRCGCARARRAPARGRRRRTERTPPPAPASSRARSDRLPPPAPGIASRLSRWCADRVRLTPSLRRQRRTSATLHACATQPRGTYGGSASKISAIDPTQASFSRASKPSRKRAGARAILRMRFQPRIDERADQPRPDRALMIRRVARPQIARNRPPCSRDAPARACAVRPASAEVAATASSTASHRSRSSTGWSSAIEST